MISGAISAARNPYSDEAKEHAKKYDGLVKSMKNDVPKRAIATGIAEEYVQNFIFYEKHDLFSNDYIFPIKLMLCKPA